MYFEEPNPPQKKNSSFKKQGSNLCDHKAHADQLVYKKGIHTCEPSDGQAFEFLDEIEGHGKQPCILASESLP